MFECRGYTLWDMKITAKVTYGPTQFEKLKDGFQDAPNRAKSQRVVRSQVFHSGLPPFLCQPSFHKTFVHVGIKIPSIAFFSSPFPFHLLKSWLDPITAEPEFTRQYLEEPRKFTTPPSSS